jgi:hypothetical protein
MTLPNLTPYKLKDCIVSFLPNLCCTVNPVCLILDKKCCQECHYQLIYKYGLEDYIKEREEKAINNFMAQRLVNINQQQQAQNQYQSQLGQYQQQGSYTQYTNVLGGLCGQ